MAKFATTRKTPPVDVRSPADVLTRVEALRARGVRVEFTDELVDVNFTTNERAHVFACIGALTRPDGPKGPATFVVYDGDEDTRRAMLEIVEYKTADDQYQCTCREYCECPDRPSFPDACRSRARSGGADDYYAVISLNRAGWFMERMILRQQLDRKYICRECGAGVNTYKVLRGGWVCDKCAAPEADAPEAEAVLNCRRQSAELHRQACAADEAGDTAEARRLRKAADEAGSDERMERGIRIAQFDLAIEGAREDLRDLLERRRQLGE